MNTLVLFNNKGGVGKTSLTYHLAWMYSDLGLRVVAADLDPQANLSSMFLDEGRLEELWPDSEHTQTILGAITPILRGTGDIRTPHVEAITDNIGLLVGDLGLSSFEDKLSDAWPRCQDRDESAFRILSAFYRLLESASLAREAELVLIDVGPNLGAVNRAAIIAANSVVIPLAPDLFSLQGLKNVGPTLRSWRDQWKDRHTKNPAKELSLPAGRMQPVGYVVMQHATRADRPVKAYERWIARIPPTYAQEVLALTDSIPTTFKDDPNCLALLKNYRSLMPMAQDALKPMFHLKAADGALGAHINAVRSCHDDFKRLAEAIAERCDVSIPRQVGTLF